MRFFIKLSYNGTRYNGLQIQNTGITVEEVIEKCLSHLLGIKVDIIGYGRPIKVYTLKNFAILDYEKQ